MTAEQEAACYDIHGLVRVRTTVRGLEIPEYFRVPATNPNLEIRLVTSTGPDPRREARRMVGFGAYDTGPHEILFECDIPFIYLLGARTRWTSRIRGLDQEETSIETTVPFFGAAPVRAKVTQFMARMMKIVQGVKLTGQGYAPCYATAVSVGEDASLLLGYSWSGKSTVASMLVDAGFSYLSDDYAILDSGGAVRCYPDWHQPRTISAQVPLLRYLKKSPLDSRSPRFREPPVRSQAKIRSIVFLERGADSVEELDGDETLRRFRLINSEELEKNWSSPISQLVSYYAYLHPAFDLSALLARYHACLESALDRADARYVVRSRSPRFEAVRGVLSRA